VRRVICLVLGGLASCSPAPRDANWFAANPDAATAILATCAAGAGGHECENARSGLNRSKAQARLQRYRRGGR
jgi:hypothetical protein